MSCLSMRRDWGPVGEVGQWVNELDIDDIVRTVHSGVASIVHPSIAIAVEAERNLAGREPQLHPLPAIAGGS